MSDARYTPPTVTDLGTLEELTLGTNEALGDDNFLFAFEGGGDPGISG